MAAKLFLKIEPPDEHMEMDFIEMASSSSSLSDSPTSITTETDPDTKQIHGICAVCGDSATGLHYFTLSCNGCKTFFRRCVVNDRKFVCRNGGNCNFDKNRRCSCRACRYQKCIDVGMNASAIQYTPSANLTLSIAKKRFSKQFRQKKTDVKIDSRLFKTVHNQILQTIGCVLRIEEKYFRLRNSNYYPYEDETGLEDCITSKCALAEAEKYQIVENWPKRPVIDMSKYEMKKMGVKFWYFVDMLLSVEYIKTFEFYNCLNDADKEAWARSATVALTVFSASYYSYIQKSEVIIYPDGSMPLYLKKFEDLNELEKKLRFQVISNVQDLKMDQVQYALTRAVVALNDSSPFLSDDAREIITEERSKYSLALLKYLQNKLGIEDGTKVFGETIGFLSGLYRKTEYNKAYCAYRQFVTCDSMIQSKMMKQLLLDVQ